MKKERPTEDLVDTSLTIRLKSHILKDLKQMEKNTKRSLDDLVSTALLMFIATHSDYLGRKAAEK